MRFYLKPDNFTFDLNNSTCQTYGKPNDPLLYLNVKSDFSLKIIKGILKSIAHRLNTNFSEANAFNKAKMEYETVLKYSWIFNKLTYVQNNINNYNDIRNRNRNIIWFTASPLQNCYAKRKENIFPVDKKLLRKNCNIQKLFNKYTLRMSYCCMDNIKKIVRKYNLKILNKKHNKMPSTCNCGEKDDLWT